jgi:hypothetical protein
MIDGARLATPGLLAAALDLLRIQPNVAAATLGFHLGPDMQVRSALNGYDQTAEDALLDRIGWPEDGYRLFNVAALAGSSGKGWFGPLNESNGLFLSRAAFLRLGGYEERFDLPGGGYVNLDFFRRVCEDSGLSVVRLLGEATFHQIHGGAATGLHPDELQNQLRRWKAQYQEIRGRPFASSSEQPLLYGRVGAHSMPWLAKSIELLNS